MNGFERYTKKTRRQVFLEEMDKLSRWQECARSSNPIIPSRGMGVRRWEWSGCCGFIFCSSGLTCRTRPWKRPCMTRR